MRLKTVCILAIMVLTALIAGCIDDLVPVEDPEIPDPGIYEFEIFIDETIEPGTVQNTTSIYLTDNDTVRIVHMVISTSRIEIIPMERLIRSSGDTIGDIVILAAPSNTTEPTVDTFSRFAKDSEINELKATEYTVSEEIRRGREHIYLDFEEPVTGFVAYTLFDQGQQDFMYTLTSPEIVRVVIPEKYTTGNRVLGYPRPDPDERFQDENGRDVIIWHRLDHDPENSREFISVGYYSRSAPSILTYSTLILIFGAMIIIVNYYRNRKKIKKMKEDMDYQINGKDK
ncbi:conserved hypothetical protein [Methanosalsum zhilinae DSM 4017]|uniref:Uncharacterized protein n=1 Tax=Methanosalsum zhilinae (strain DSM 4017 / NBRC 107636 / OCM 62 / WeN5) TaxID=679901 RepID=F7XMD0_METZD|nr:DUF5803 family protein [Methanosalsum zhilinae]AEH61613.1 conserved hypothetical protein [Methanosalsum zhilinae DSM 4017]